MTRNLYKYAGPDIRSRMLPGPDGAVFKCTYPRDFNDPYELFLSIDRNEQPELLAFYADVIGELHQLPTTCFSRSPAVIPMWAHYAQNGEGFVVEVDEACVARRYPESGFGDVDYRNTPHPELNSSLEYAYMTTKPRHTYLLRKAVFSAAYYTKASCWRYEQERRMVVAETDVRIERHLLLLHIPKDAISRIICGPKATEEVRQYLRDRDAGLACPFIEMRIGRTTSIPYFLDGEGRVWTFQRRRFVEATELCSQCGEPLSADEDLCSLCSIQDAHKDQAAERNPFRMLHRFGMLSDYVRDMNEISEGTPSQRRKDQQL